MTFVQYKTTRNADEDTMWPLSMVHRTSAYTEPQPRHSLLDMAPRLGPYYTGLVGHETYLFRDPLFDMLNFVHGGWFASYWNGLLFNIDL